MGLPGAARRRHAILGAGVTVLVGAGVWALIGQEASFSRISHAVRSAAAWWLALAAAGSAIGYLGYALLYQAVSQARGGPRPHLRLALRMTIVVFGAAVVATGAGRLGAEYWSLRKMRQKPALAVARVLTLNTALWAVLAALTAVAAILALAEQAPHVPLALELSWLIVVPACALPAVWLSSPRRRPVVADRGGWIGGVVSPVVDALVMLRVVSTWRPMSLGGILGALVYWAGQLIVVWAGLRGFGVPIGYAPLLLGYATGYASTILPLPFGGIGGVDAATVYALTLVGVPLGPALLATLIQRVLTYWLPLGVAILFARSLRHLGRDLSFVGETDPID